MIKVTMIPKKSPPNIQTKYFSISGKNHSLRPATNVFAIAPQIGFLCRSGHESLQESSYPVFPFIGRLPPEVALVNVKRVIAEARYQFSMFPWLTRNIPEVKYIYDSHNAVISTHKTNCSQVNFTQIVTLHDRGGAREAIRTEQRRMMNRINLLKDLQKNKNDPRALFYLANEYFSFKEYNKAIEYYKRYINISDFAEEKYQAKLSCARCLKVVGRDKDCVDMFLDCFKDPVPRNDHMIYLADFYTDINISLSIHYFKLAACVQEPVSPMWIDCAFYLDYPLKRLCSIYSRVGRLEDAQLCIDILKSRGCTNLTEIEEVEKEIKEAMENENKSWDSYHDTGLDVEKLSVSCAENEVFCV
jgi:hypothetical protein